VRRLAAVLPALAVLTGCGVSVNLHTGVTTTTTTTSITTPTGNRTFSSPGIALHFTYPAAFSPGRINSVSRKIESDRHVTRAALRVGSSGYDLLIVTRYANIKPPVSRGNIHAQKAEFDRAMSKIFSRAAVGAVDTIGGLPALRYPDAPTPGVPVSATTRAAFVFLGKDEYELQCQWTVAERAAVLNACAQMLRTLRT
jgi:hypothetical protein